jgi:outer membrane lipoprotein-sorting protein
VLILSACSASKPEEKELQKIPIKEIKQKVNQISHAIETLEANGTISIDSPEMSSSGSIEIKIKKPDTVYVKIEGPFGIDIALALITRNDFIYYNVQENKVYSGPSTDINIGAILRIKISFDQLINSFSGSFHFEDELTDSTEAASENNSYVLQVNRPLYKQKYYVDPINYFISRYTALDVSNKPVLDVNYSNFKTEIAEGLNINFPYNITINRPENNQTVWLQYETKEINKKNLTFKMKVPKSAKVIKWN